MNNYELFSFENNNSLNVNVLKPMNEYKKNVNYLFEGLENAKPIYEIPDKLYRDEFLEQDIEIDISSNDFRKIWNKYENKYDEGINSDIININENVIDVDDVEMVGYKDNLDVFYSKVKELDSYLINLSETRKELINKKELLELSQKEVEQEKELLKIEKEKFEEYKNNEKEKLNKDIMNFQLMVEEIKNKIDDILN